MTLSKRAELACVLDGALMRHTYIMRTARAKLRLKVGDTYGGSKVTQAMLDGWAALVEKSAREIQSIVTDYMIQVILLEAEDDQS